MKTPTENVISVLVWFYYIIHILKNTIIYFIAKFVSEKCFLHYWSIIDQYIQETQITKFVERILSILCVKRIIKTKE